MTQRVRSGEARARGRTMALLPVAVGTWGQAVKALRDQLKALLPGRTAPKRFGRRFVDVTFISQAQEDEQLAAIERLARETLEAGERRPA